MSKYVIIEDQDGGFIVAELKFTTNNIPIYRYVEYYHTLESAVESIK